MLLVHINIRKDKVYFSNPRWEIRETQAIRIKNSTIKIMEKCTGCDFYIYIYIYVYMYISDLLPVLKKQ